jgi:hypothetical protein
MIHNRNRFCIKLGAAELRITRIVQRTIRAYDMLNTEDAALGRYRHPLQRS